MFRLLLLIGLSSLLYMTPAQAVPSKECKSCMSACPHKSKDLKKCDRNCPKVCSPSDVAEINGNSVSACGKCMSACPHMSRDVKPCDRGCPEVCDANKLAKLLTKANAQLRNCGAGSKHKDYEDEAGASAQ